MRDSRTNPALSAYTNMFVDYDYKSTPMPPPGTKLVTYKKNVSISSWTSQGTIGCYVLPALNYYRFHRLVVAKIGAERIIDMVKLYAKMFTLPTPNTANATTQTSETLVRTIQEPHHCYPLHHLQYQQHSTLNNLSKIFKIKDTKIMRVTKPKYTEPKTTTTISTRVKNRDTKEKTCISSEIVKEKENNRKLDATIKTKYSGKTQQNPGQHQCLRIE